LLPASAGARHLNSARRLIADGYTCLYWRVWRRAIYVSVLELLLAAAGSRAGTGRFWRRVRVCLLSTQHWPAGSIARAFGVEFWAYFSIKFWNVYFCDVPVHRESPPGDAVRAHIESECWYTLSHKVEESIF